MAAVTCSFCGRRKNEVDLLLSGIDAHICNNCIEQGHQVVLEEFGRKEDKKGKKKLPKINLIPPAEIKKFLDQYVIELDEDTRSLSVAVYNHYKHHTHRMEDADVMMEIST